MNYLDRMCYDTGGYTVQEILSSFCKKILEIIDLVNKNEEVCDEAHALIENIRNEVVPDLVDDIMKEMQDTGYFDSLVNVTLIEQLRTELTHPQFRRIITNLYIYSVLFVLNNEKKSKDVIDHTIRDATSQAEERVSLIIAAAKALRESQVEGYSPNSQAKFEELAIIYSITDNYVSNNNWIPALYSRDENFNLEHLVIPDQRAAKIKWNPDGNSFDIPIDPAFAKTNKKKTCNFLVLDHDLNEELNNFDIVTKLKMIRHWHTVRDIPLPKHINTIISHIESLEEYRRLKVYQENSAELATVLPVYHLFLAKYFSEEHEQILLSSLRDNFSQSFRN